MALADYALVTIVQARDRVGIVAADVRGGELERLVNEASRMVLTFTGREYAPTQPPVGSVAADTVRTVAYRQGASYIDLYPFEARSVSAVTIGDGGLLDSASYTLEPIANRDGVYDRIVLHGWHGSLPRGRRVPVSVAGRWGWPAVPADVQGWVLEIIEDRWRNDSAFFADASGEVSLDSGESSSTPRTLPYRIREEMEAVRRTRIGAG